MSKEALAQFRRGLEMVRQGKAEEARVIFAEVYAIAPVPDILWNLALMEFEVKRYVDALAHFRMYQKDPKAKPEASLPKLMEEASQATGHIRIEAPTTARVRVDQKLIPAEANAEPVDVTPGKHVVEVSFQGKTQTKDVEAPAGKIVPAKFVFNAIGSDLIQDPHNGETEPTSFWTTRTTTAILLGAGAVVSFGVATGFALNASGKEDSRNEKLALVGPSGCPARAECASIRQLWDDQKTSTTLANVFLVVGGVLTVAGVGALFVIPDRPKEKTSGPKVTPVVSPQGAGFQLTATF